MVIHMSFFFKLIVNINIVLEEEESQGVQKLIWNQMEARGLLVGVILS